MPLVSVLASIRTALLPSSCTTRWWTAETSLLYTRVSDGDIGGSSMLGQGGIEGKVWESWWLLKERLIGLTKEG